jgi:hypothetical protein
MGHQRRYTGLAIGGPAAGRNLQNDDEYCRYRPPVRLNPSISVVTEAPSMEHTRETIYRHVVIHRIDNAVSTKRGFWILAENFERTDPVLFVIDHLAVFYRDHVGGKKRHKPKRRR